MWVDLQTRCMTRVPLAWMWTSNSPSTANTLQWTYETLWGVVTSHIQLTFWRTGSAPDEWLSQLHVISGDMHVEIVEQLVASLMGLQRKLDKLDHPEFVLEAIDYATWDDEVDSDMVKDFHEPFSRRVDDSSSVGPVSWDDRTRRMFMHRLMRTHEKKVRRHSYTSPSSMSPTASEEICFHSPMTSLASVHEDIEYGL
ncbi:unnamed protein product [Closterium sp. NIES-64]|nr:unnamed protein product [Closterium sp. NIES-64]CAI5974508.1 unnamed protein product [Closterium sp. NIES-64]